MTRPGGVWIARHVVDGRRTWRVRVALGEDVLEALDTNAGERLAYDWLPRDPGPSRLALAITSLAPWPQLYGEADYAYTIVSRMPAGMALAAHAAERCEWSAGAGRAIVRLPSWFYAGTGEPAYVPGGRKPAVELSAGALAEIHRRLETGEVGVALAREHGVTPGMLRWQLHKAGLVTRHRQAAEAYSAPRPRTPPKERPCMRCRVPFESEGPHNRMCASCRTPSGLSRQFEAASL